MNYWNNHVREQFKEGYGMCDSIVREIYGKQCAIMLYDNYCGT